MINAAGRRIDRYGGGSMNLRYHLRWFLNHCGASAGVILLTACHGVPTTPSSESINHTQQSYLRTTDQLRATIKIMARDTSNTPEAAGRLRVELDQFRSISRAHTEFNKLFETLGVTSENDLQPLVKQLSVLQEVRIARKL
jgi:hypothetical protein